ncbi:MAG: sulfotransferase domain-containing protein [Lachnospiraceae bacterium]|nr:sulfotransferase domain-containing protein [Lachnospiraceae bacterium]
MDTAVVAKKYIFTADELKEILENENRIIIYGAGEYGKQIADYIISVGKQAKIESFWVTREQSENEYRGIKIWESKKGNLTLQGDYLIIISVSLVYQAEIVKTVQQYQSRYRCMTLDLYNEIRKKADSDFVPESTYVPYKGLDFLVAGFSKCGTTSLHQALLEVDDIYLSKTKESEFFEWCDCVENSRERLVETYFNRIQDGQIVGMIEPTFFKNAKRVADFFGKQVKILFLVRNPVDASFSAFKMYSRGSCAGELKDAYMKSGGMCGLTTFEYWFEQNCDHMFLDYADWMKPFFEYYSKEQIKIIIFEEMIKKPKEVVNEILQFIGSSKKYSHEELPYVNEGKFVMADMRGLEIAQKCGKMEVLYRYPDGVLGRNRDEVYSEYLEVKEQFRQAKKIYNMKLSEDMRKKLEMYYYDKVRELEKLLNKNLSQIWF